MFFPSSVLQIRVGDKGINKGRKIKWRRNAQLSSISDEFTTNMLENKEGKKKKRTGRQKTQAKAICDGKFAHQQHRIAAEAHTSGGDYSHMSFMSGSEVWGLCLEHRATAHMCSKSKRAS